MKIKGLYDKEYIVYYLSETSVSVLAALLFLI